MINSFKVSNKDFFIKITIFFIVLVFIIGIFSEFFVSSDNNIVNFKYANSINKYEIIKTISERQKFSDNKNITKDINQLT